MSFNIRFLIQHAVSLCEKLGIEANRETIKTIVSHFEEVARKQRSVSSMKAQRGFLENRKIVEGAKMSQEDVAYVNFLGTKLTEPDFDAPTPVISYWLSSSVNNYTRSEPVETLDKVRERVVFYLEEYSVMMDNESLYQMENTKSMKMLEWLANQQEFIKFEISEVKKWEWK